jgi:hypothetical protein
MKSSRIISIVFLVPALTLALLNSCVKQDFDQPPVIIPKVDFTSNVTIAGLKDMYSGALMEITADTIIQGIVTANDESGNIYKKLYIQDNTAGIELTIDQVDLYTEYKLGQRIFIKCKGLYIGAYGGTIQLGYGDYNGSPNRIPAVMIPDHIFRDSLPGKAPVPFILNLAGSLNEKISMLVQVDSVRFPDHGKPFVASGESYTNRDIADKFGNVIVIGGENFIVRSSSYANFANTPMPDGKGSLVGILSIYNGQYQMYIRDINDCVKFDTAGIPPSLTTIYEQMFNSDPPDWVVYSIASNKDWYWDATYTCMVANGYQGDVPSEDWLISPGIDLTNVTSPVLTFKTWTKYTDNGLANPLEVFISTDYSGSGNPSGATWTPLPATLPAANSSTWTSSGDVDLSAYQQKVYIGFRYRSSGTSSSTASKWEVDTFTVSGYE